MISQEITHLHQNTDKGGVNLLSNSFKKLGFSKDLNASGKIKKIMVFFELSLSKIDNPPILFTIQVLDIRS
jgi:hypothetical protein